MFVIDRSEDELRESLYDAVDRMSLVNIVILLMLVQVVKVVSYLRPGERELETQARPQIEDKSKTPGLDSLLFATDDANHWADAGRYLDPMPRSARELARDVDWPSMRPVPYELHGEWVAARPSVTLNINPNMLSDEEYDEILQSLRGAQSGDNAITIINKALAKGSIDIEVESYSIDCGPVGRGELSITGQMHLEDVLDDDWPALRSWSNADYGIGLCTPSRGMGLTGGARQGIRAYRLNRNGQSVPL